MEKCHECSTPENKSLKGLKRGWTQSLYCSYDCELQAVSKIHGGMPGGSLPRKNWVPVHLGREIEKRWN